MHRRISTIALLVLGCLLPGFASLVYGDMPPGLSKIVDLLHQARGFSGIGGGLSDTDKEKETLKEAWIGLQSPLVSDLPSLAGYAGDLKSALASIQAAMTGLDKGDPKSSVDENIRAAIDGVQLANARIEMNASPNLAGLPFELGDPYHLLRLAQIDNENTFPEKEKKAVQFAARDLSRPTATNLSASPDYPADRQAAIDAIHALGADIDKGSPQTTVDNYFQTAFTALQACIDLYRKQPAADLQAATPPAVSTGATPSPANSDLKVTFVPEGSAQLEARGFKWKDFPAMDTSDPNDIALGKPLYFDLHTGKTIQYKIESAKPLTKLIYTGVAFESFIMEIRDLDGNVLARSGPFNDGNHQKTIEVPLPRLTQFEVVITDNPRDWLLIISVGFESDGVALAASPPPSTSATNAPATTPEEHDVTPVALTADQARAVVLIKGDNGEGTGFLVKTADGPAVMTNIHVISNNPNLKITTNTGSLITVLSVKGADDRDMVMMLIKDNKYSYLTLATDVSGTVQPGDAVITPGNSEGGEVMLNTAGKVLGIGPDRIEFDNPIYHGNSGGPVFHVKSGTVIGIVTEGMKVDNTDDLDKASFANRNSAIGHTMRYFGFRIDNVPNWEVYDWRRFQNETAFLDAFEHRNRCLDNFLNAPNDTKPEDLVWEEDDKIMKANSDFFDQAAGSDSSQRMDATRVMWSEFNDIANLDMDAIQNPNNFYSFDRQRAKEAIAYRKALRVELNQISDNVSKLGSMPRQNN
jgi:S1-C subfamily serine protease